MYFIRINVSKSADIPCRTSRLSIEACLPNLTNLTARVTFGPEGEETAYSILASRVQQLHLLLVNPGPGIEGVNLCHRVLLKADPRLVVLSTEPLRDLCKLKELEERNYNYQLAYTNCGLFRSSG